MGTPPVCLGCLRLLSDNNNTKNGNEIFLCRVCGWPMCSKKCSEKKIHRRMECQFLARAKDKISFSDLSSPHDYYRAIAPLRLLLLLHNPEAAGGSNPESVGYSDRFSLLMDHNEERRKDDQMWGIYRKYVNDFLRIDCQLSDVFTDEEIDRAVGIFWTNAFSCRGSGGQAVYPTFSFASHSCISNANHVVFPDRHLALQAKKFIREGEELTISYISPVQSTMRRKAKLRDKWFFECSCARCSDPTEKGSHSSSLICQAKVVQNQLKKCGEVMNGHLDEQLWKCQRCSNKISQNEVLQLENDIAKELQRFEDQNDLSQFYSLYDKYCVILHPNHYLLLMLKRHIIILSSNQFSEMTLVELQKIKDMCEEVLHVLNIIDPGYTRDRGVILRHMSEVNKLCCRKMFQAELITHDVFTRKVHECMILFEESQRCMSMLVKK